MRGESRLSKSKWREKPSNLEPLSQRKSRVGCKQAEKHHQKMYFYATVS